MKKESENETSTDIDCDRAKTKKFAELTATHEKHVGIYWQSSVSFLDYEVVERLCKRRRRRRMIHTRCDFSEKNTFSPAALTISETFSDHPYLHRWTRRRTVSLSELEVNLSGIGGCSPFSLLVDVYFIRVKNVRLSVPTEKRREEKESRRRNTILQIRFLVLLLIWRAKKKSKNTRTHLHILYINTASKERNAMLKHF